MRAKYPFTCNPPPPPLSRTYAQEQGQRHISPGWGGGGGRIKAYEKTMSPPFFKAGDEDRSYPALKKINVLLLRTTHACKLTREAGPQMSSANMLTDFQRAFAVCLTRDNIRNMNGLCCLFFYLAPRDAGPLGPSGFSSSNIAQRHTVPQKGLQREHFCFRITFRLYFLSASEAGPLGP